MSDISLIWSEKGYGGFQGWMYVGPEKLVVASDDSPLMKALGVTVSTEGGSPTAFNGYDQCVWSVGLIQLCGSLGLAAGLMQVLRDAGIGLTKEYDDWLAARGLSMKAGRLWKGNIQITRGLEMAEALYGCNGRKGSWTPESKEQAASFARAVIQVLRKPSSISLQLAHVSSRLLNFVVKDVKKLLYPDGFVGEGWYGALQAIFMSFSANNPTIAATQFMEYVTANGFHPDDADFVIGAAKKLTFGPKIGIYGDRYAAIRNKVEELYGVDLPDRPAELLAWRQEMGVKHESELTPFNIQKKLAQLGYDPGPLDGRWGQKTSAAVRLFQYARGLGVDGIVGAKTWAALVQATETT